MGTNPYDDILSTDKEALPKAIKRAKKTLERADKFLKTIQLQKLTSINNLKGVPKNATIRKEQIKCGKWNCLWRHGPYYYAYWKDENGQLRKKYIGKHLPESIKKGYGSRISSSPIETNPSENDR